MLAAIALFFMPYWAATQSATVPTDFAIHFEFGLCWRDIVDTSTDRYVRDLVIDDATRTVPLGLKESQRRKLAQWVAESRFFDLPVELDSSEAKNGVITEHIPSESFVIVIQRSGVRHQVKFDDTGDATSDAVVRARTLVHRLERFFTELPRVKRLPKPPVGCL
jgi:hypothetical protein